MNTSTRSLTDEMVAFLRAAPEGASGPALAERFLKLKNAPAAMAQAAIKAVLANDVRVTLENSGMWHARAAAAPGTALDITALPWCAVYCCTQAQTGRIAWFGAWDCTNGVSLLQETWLLDPRRLDAEERELLTTDDGENDSYDADAVRTRCAAFARLTADRILVFLSAAHRDQLADWCAASAVNMSDDSLLIRELLRAAGGSIPRTLDLASLETALFGSEQVSGMSVSRQGERFALAVVELIGLLKRQGIESRSALDERDTRERQPLFAGKKFSYTDILALPASPGVYAFKDEHDAFCYIGKAANLRRRLSSYWKDTDESPEKIGQLRAMAHTLVTHRCGSELECLLQEYRLIRKYTPLLNSQIAIGERKGVYSPIDDCIVLLPHAKAGKGVSVWFRKGQKILLRPFEADFASAEPLKTELDAFFFKDTLPATASDFPEQEIAVRWIKKHADALAMVPVSRMGDAGEVYEAFAIAWREFSENLPRAPGDRLF